MMLPDKNFILLKKYDYFKDMKLHKKTQLVITIIIFIFFEFFKVKINILYYNL